MSQGYVSRFRTWFQNPPDARSLRRLLWLVPMGSIYVPFMVVPIAVVFVLSLFSWTNTGDIAFVGLDNYVRLFEGDLLYRVLGNTVTYTVINTVFTVGGGLLLALAIRGTYDRLRSLFQTAFLLPYAIMSVGVGMIWGLMYHPRRGVLNSLLVEVGVESPPLWLGESSLALPSIAVAGIWWSIGFYTVIWLVGLANVDERLYEAAKIDGADRYQMFRYITLPQLKPIGLFLLIISIITSLRIFGLVWVMTRGGPNRASEVMVTWMYKVAFVENNLGLASAIGVLLFLITMGVSVLNIKYVGLGGE